MRTVIIVKPCNLEKNKDMKRIIRKKIDTEIVDYKTLRGFVGGTIEHYQLARELDENGIDCWIDDEGKLKGLEPTFNLLDHKTNEILDRIVGPVVFTGYNNAETLSLTEEQEQIVINWLYSLDTSICATRDLKQFYSVFNVPGFVSMKERFEQMER